MNILSTFLELTCRTYPHGTESEMFHLLPDEIETDEFGNKFMIIGENPSVMFASHLDTATSANTTVTHVLDNSEVGKHIIKTDGTTILGADDKAGVTIMLYMIHNKVPGLYYFFLGEEVGCVGSKKLSNKLKTEKIEGIDKVISFDRRGTTSVITHQFSTRCCSDEFAQALSEQLNSASLTDYTNANKFNYSPDPTGLYTDSAQFITIYPECTNISVGYKSEHTFSEEQDFYHLEKLANVCLLIDWEKLPIVRDPSKVEHRSYSSAYWDWEDDWNDGWYGGGGVYSSYPTVVAKPANEKFHFMDDDFRYISTIEFKMPERKIVSMELYKGRVQREYELISDLLEMLNVECDSILWDGVNLQVLYENHRTDHHRDDLVEFIPELDFWKKEFDGRWSE